MLDRSISDVIRDNSFHNDGTGHQCMHDTAIKEEHAGEIARTGRYSGMAVGSFFWCPDPSDE
jgi:hypothetical protein